MHRGNIQDASVFLTEASMKIKFTHIRPRFFNHVY